MRTAGNPARAAPPPGCGEKAGSACPGTLECRHLSAGRREVRRAAQGQCRLNEVSRGGADSARPETRRMVSPPDRRRPRMHVEVGLSTRPSSGPSTRVAPAAAWTGRGRCFGRVFRHGPCLAYAKHVRHRPAPVSRPNRLTRASGKGPGPVAGFARRSRKSAARQRNRVGHRLPLPDTLTFAWQIRGYSLPPASKRSRSIRQRERTESGMGMEGVEKMGWVLWVWTGLVGGVGWDYELEKEGVGRFIRRLGHPLPSRALAALNGPSPD